ncbi:adenylyl-sulfate kinase [Heyndrickxia acidicola]|uniref:Adenylyl-sulfate kinase n=1 Tax=Heyndrickxia acidicola TaxID=209389 RepID=A0ABU6MGA8_9BACI|nr:adenylyl-sulfate kinase [Heyndrickxia acidicola]MED1203448.1 adenylyl-sulfate kinase [Heyndrickxia acidicola]
MSDAYDKNLAWHFMRIKKEDRQKRRGHNSFVLWFTGLSGSGKSTLASCVEEKLFSMGIATYVLDGDNVRLGLNKDLGFSQQDRTENIRRIGEVSKLFIDAGIVTLTAFISPYKSDRQLVRSLLEEGEFIEIYTKCSIEACEKRDPKGFYKLARQGKISDFTGISSPYQPPRQPEITIDTELQSADEGADDIIQYLIKHEYLTR